MQTSLLGLAKQAQSHTGNRIALGLPAEASVYEEPGAGKLHAGICAGAVGQLAVLPRSSDLCFLDKVFPGNSPRPVGK